MKEEGEGAQVNNAAIVFLFPLRTTPSTLRSSYNTLASLALIV